MSVIAIPYGETLDPYSSNESIKKARTVASYKFHGRKSPLLSRQWSRIRNENNATKCLSPASCDPLLDFINLDDFKDDETLQRNFEEVLKIHKMGFPVKIVKQRWFPGLICIPIFHCQRCLALWTQVARVPSLCSEVNRSVYGRLIPISITKCDLLTRLLNDDRKPTGSRLCKQLSVSKPVKPEVEPERSSFGGKTFRPIPVAEFVDINKQLQKYRRKFMRELKGVGSGASGMNLESGRPASSPVDDYGSEGKVKAQGGIACGDTKGRMEIVDSNCGNEVYSEEMNAVDEDVKFKPKNYNARIHDRSCYVKRNKDGYRARPSTSRLGNRLENGLTVTSKNKAIMPTTAETKPAKPVPRQITKIKRPVPKTSLQSTSREMPLDIAYEKKLEELRQKALAFDKHALKVVFGDKLEIVFGDKVENLDAKMVNSVWFKSLVEDFSKQEEKLRTCKQELTRAFCFSYFELLRKNENVH